MRSGGGLPSLRPLASRAQLNLENVLLTRSDNENPQRFSRFQQRGSRWNKDARTIRPRRRRGGDVGGIHFLGQVIQKFLDGKPQPLQ